MPYRVDQSPKRATKVPPMYSPRTDGGGVLASRAIPPSPLSKGLDGSTGSFSSPSVDYDDVFGGPPRLATSILAAEDNHGSSAALDRSVARAPSFRSPALPVFELPVFGDAAYSSSNTFEARPASVAYDDIFREEIHVPDVYTAAGIYGNIPRSKASSRSASRRMSPIHPAASLPDQLLHEEILAAASTGAFSKGRSSVGKMEGRNSFSSPSFDEGRSKPLDPVFMAVRNDTVGSSLPASPPHSGTWGHMKRFTTSKSVHNLGAAPTSGEVDDVFGGFPQRTYPPVFQAADLGTSKSSEMPNVFIRGIAEKKVPSSPLKTKSSEPYAGLSRTLSSSSSSDGERELQDDFIEICMEKQTGGAPEKMEAAANRAWVTVSDLRQSAHPTPKKAFPRPPPVPAPASPSSGSLKHKSWKDWSSSTSKHPPVSSSSGLEDTSVAFEIGSKLKKELINCTSTSQQDKGPVEARSLKQLQNNSAAQPPRGKFTVFSPLRTALKAKPLVETMQLEERELHSMLNNAWKSNEKREKKKSLAERPAEDVSAGLIMQDSGLKEGRKQPSSVPNSFQNHQGSQSTEDKKAGLHWKSWRKHSNKEKMGSKESAKLEFAPHESKQMKAPGHNVRDIIDERAENGVNSNRLSEYEDSFDPEEIVKEVTEETSANCPNKEVDRCGNAGDDMKSHRKEAEDVEIAGDRKSVACTLDEGEVTSALSSRNGSVQDFGQFNEQQEVSLSDRVEEADLLTGLDSSLIGFQDIEGESVERRKARWMRHLHAKQRAAKALEEMQQRDAEVLRQQAEKQQLAENADRQIKRWATGKEGNLRALLSNLQHVLWSDSGWKPISLTDLIEGPDVKKAYRKATLFVHPDKLQQKGATLQQKYIAERVFDILQEAWKTFNLQELF